MKKPLKKIIFFSLSAITLVFIIKLFVFDFYTVANMSMYKTIKKGDKIIVNKFSKLNEGNIIAFEDDKTGDIKVSRLVAKNGSFVKIIEQDLFVNKKFIDFEEVAYSYCLRYISNDEEDSLRNIYLLKKINNSGFFQVELTDNEFNKILKDTLSNLKEKLVAVKKCKYNIFSEPDDFLEITVKKDSVFLLNDNRSDLFDSRMLGLIPKNKIIGKVIYVY
ncbi:MAG: signal peptidase I [Bacteroidales bacterium]|nr:signal peptidase I [Bacteroidales bacterium]